MKINLVSDMHLNFQDITMPGGDLLIMAGDIVEAGHLHNDVDDCSIKDFSRSSRISGVDPLPCKLNSRFRRFFDEEMKKYNRVLYVCGNHEHYLNEYHDTHTRIRAALPDNVTFLENESVEIDGINFYGATMWTDMNEGDRTSIAMIQLLMSDFKVITLKDPATGFLRIFDPIMAKKIFHQSLEKLIDWLALHSESPCVVITHHAPSDHSVASVYKSKYHINGGFRSVLDEFIIEHPQIKVWCHGHMHNKSDYMIGSTRILANPRGYKGHEDIAETFDPSFAFEV